MFINVYISTRLCISHVRNGNTKLMYTSVIKDDRVDYAQITTYKDDYVDSIIIIGHKIYISYIHCHRKRSRN